MLYREPKLLKHLYLLLPSVLPLQVSVLYREPKLLKPNIVHNAAKDNSDVSVLYREPKLLKRAFQPPANPLSPRFSALP